MCQPGEKIQPPKNEQVCLEMIKTNVLFEQTEVFKLVVLKISSLSTAGWQGAAQRRDRSPDYH